MIHDYVMEYLEPIYDLMGSSAPLIVFCIGLLIFLYVFGKLKNYIKAIRVKRFKVGSTNKWFSWEEYHEYKKNKEGSTKK